MTRNIFEEFQSVVLQDLDLQAKLYAIEERENFLHQVVCLGAERGFRFDKETVVAAMESNRRAWIERWIG